MPWHPVVEYDVTEESSEAGKPIVERLPASTAHAGRLTVFSELYTLYLVDDLNRYENESLARNIQLYILDLQNI